MAKLDKINTISELEGRANGTASDAGRYQRLAIDAVRNLGCEHLMRLPRGHKGRTQKPGPEHWEAALDALTAYWGSLVGEYGMSEEDAEKEMVDEINGLIDMGFPEDN